MRCGADKETDAVQKNNQVIDMEGTLKARQIASSYETKFIGGSRRKAFVH